MVGSTTVGSLLLIYLAYVIAIGIAHKFEISFSEALKKSVTLPLTPFKRLKPLTPLQKEIQEEERTINELKRQKADMERLEELKREREALFAECGKADYEARIGSHFRWCQTCGNAFSGEYCDCLEKEEYAVNPLEMIATPDDSVGKGPLKEKVDEFIEGCNELENKLASAEQDDFKKMVEAARRESKLTNVKSRKEEIY